MTVRSDGTLVLAVLDGDADAFGALVHRHQGAMFRYAVRMCGDRDDADDVVQSAFVRAYRNLAQCRERERFAAWVRQIVMNECRTLLATRGRRSRWFVTDEVVLAAVESPTTAMDPEGPELGRIERALGTLTPDLREAFLLKHMEELSYEEMAQLTGAGVSALKMRVKRACEQLREQLESRDDG